MSWFSELMLLYDYFKYLFSEVYGMELTWFPMFSHSAVLRNKFNLVERNTAVRQTSGIVLLETGLCWQNVPRALLLQTPRYVEQKQKTAHSEEGTRLQSQSWSWGPVGAATLGRCRVPEEESSLAQRHEDKGRVKNPCPVLTRGTWPTNVLTERQHPTPPPSFLVNWHSQRSDTNYPPFQEEDSPCSGKKRLSA